MTLPNASKWQHGRSASHKARTPNRVLWNNPRKKPGSAPGGGTFRLAEVLADHRRNFRYSILVIFIIAAIITPTTDIMNMCIFAAPMIVLYILSIGIAWFVHPNQRKKRAAKSASN